MYDESVYYILCWYGDNQERIEDKMAEKRILVIDDDTNICELLRVYLENEGYEVKVANDGVEGIT